MAIAILFFMVWLSIQPWNWINPTTLTGQCLTVLLCILFFAIIAMIVAGVFMYDVKMPEDEDDILN